MLCHENVISRSEIIFFYKGRRGRDHMVVGYTTIHVQSVPITTNVVSSNPAHGEVYSIQIRRYNIMWSSLSMTCGWSVVFSDFLHQ